MTRIAFLTLFLGLTLSQQKVEVSVTGPVQRVEFLLDGKIVAALTREPWTATVDFGTHLLPRRLVARAIDRDGKEVASVEQRINLPRSAAETQIVLERDDTGTPRAARLVWQSLEGEAPKRVELLLDSRSIPIDSDLRATLPPIDNAQPHILRARLVSRLGVLSDSEIAFGGGLEDATTAELTAVVVRAPDAEKRLTVGGVPATVVGVEHIPGEVLIVRHPIETEASFRLDPTRRIAKRRSALSASTTALESLGTKPVARFMWPAGTRTGKADLFPPSRSYAFSNADEFKRILTEVGFPGAPKELRFADAVAVAGIQALAASRPRAVVLVLGESASDASRLEPKQVREYLASAGVPLYVWSLTGNQERWSDAQDISSPHGFSAAFDKLQQDLQSQRIVWVRGNFLPSEIHVDALDRIDRAAADFMAATKTPGLAVAVVQDDRIAYSKGFGGVT
ncbi:MAG TPA: hypothetical protein VII12_01245, partial [Thermoanaerobaculia bacterium]